ncbi:Las1-like protein [Kalmanozyma brasiliensis GHG001]|uniref:Las1-domain-containing protein n=1 Tax=Kalmanozyma brasiliensis (strain GHG001) TaxID=1365824 RepID=V5EUJ2_KALBG|nr:Las1-like protein [Kalmanozyma brasiliensis GHG001]EST05799.1 Las1-like protein [Kalmanozyma brasiliensis GHG001]
MKPPKRSPFLHSRQAELLEIFRHLYPDSQAHFSAKDRHDALSTVQLWINRSACPFAVETTALLVQSVILDEHMQQIAASSIGSDSASTSSPRYALEQLGGGAELGVRLNYSLALTRFVNSVVDSHQTGGFAQSIGAIAARIGLPQWFVEIRHAVTHEELPSINVCRQAAGLALAWLRRHFWIPQLFEGPNAIRFGNDEGEAMDVDAEASTSQVTTKESEAEKTRKKDRRKALQDLRQTLSDYRTLAKQVTRDRSLAKKSKDQFSRLYKQFSGFVYRMRTLDPSFGAQLIDSAHKKGKDEEIDVRGAAVMDPDDVDECTRAALGALVNQLVKPGGMVPLGRSKRVQVEDEVVLPGELASLWMPLLGYMRDTYGPIFGQILAEELVEGAVREMEPVDDASDTLMQVDAGVEAPADADSDPHNQAWKTIAYTDPTYRETADAWLRHLVAHAPPTSHASTSRGTTTLITDAEVAELCLPLRFPASTSILEFLCERNVELKTRIGPLVDVLKVSAFVTATSSDDEDVQTPMQDESGFESQLEVMQRRLVEMEGLEWGENSGDSGQRSYDTAQNETIDAVEGAAMVDVAAKKMPTGWSMAPADWKPTPFGCLSGKIPNLVV